MAEDTRNRRAGIMQMGEVDPGNLASYAENARIEDSGISVAEVKRLLRRVAKLEAMMEKHGKREAAD